MVTTRPPKTIVKPTALGPVANTDTKLLIYGLFQKGRVLAQDALGIISGDFDGINKVASLGSHRGSIILPRQFTRRNFRRRVSQSVVQSRLLLLEFFDITTCSAVDCFQFSVWLFFTLQGSSELRFLRNDLLSQPLELFPQIFPFGIVHQALVLKIVGIVLDQLFNAVVIGQILEAVLLSPTHFQQANYFGRRCLRNIGDNRNLAFLIFNDQGPQ